MGGSPSFIVLVTLPYDWLITSGTASASVRVAGYPENTLMVSVKAPFDNLAIRGQPDFIEPATGILTALATYNTATRVFALTTTDESSDVNSKPCILALR